MKYILEREFFDKITVYRGGDGDDYFTTDKSHAASFGKVRVFTISENAKIFDINNEEQFDELLDMVSSIKFSADGTVFNSFEEFSEHNNNDIIAEANNSWIVEDYSEEIKKLGYDIAQFMDGGSESFLVFNKKMITLIG